MDRGSAKMKTNVGMMLLLLQAAWHGITLHGRVVPHPTVLLLLSRST